jgi:hypothetical protein
MSDDKPANPLEDLKQGLGLIFKAAKGAVEKIPTEKVEGVAKDAAKEINRAFETVGNEIDKAFGHKPTPPPAEAKKAEEEAPKPEEPQHFDDAYAPEPPPKGPRVG